MAQIMRLENIRTSAGSVFMDNLTISHALRPLIGYEIRDVTDKESPLYKFIGEELLLYNDHGLFKQKGDKWNYPLNDAFRFAVDIYSLSQLVEAVILFENIFIDIFWMDRWGSIVRGDNSVDFPGIASSLDSIIVPVRLPFDQRINFLASAALKAKIYSKTHAFIDFMRLLSITGTESAFIHMTHAYYQTGYSDKEIFPQNEILPLDHTSPYIQGMIERSKDSALINDLSRVVDEIDHYWKEMANSEVLSNTDFDEGDIHDKASASEDVLRNATAALFYKFVAAECNLPYFPHLLRSYFVGYDQIVSSLDPVSTAQRIVASIERARIEKIQPINSFYGIEVIDLRIPFFLSLILQNIDSPSQIFSAALQIRNSKEAKAFRKWTSELDQRLSEGTINLNTLQKEIKDIESYLSNWSGISDTANSKTQIGISFGPVQVTKPAPEIKLLKPKKTHMVFLQRLTQINDETGNFASNIANVFGQKVGDVFRKYQKTILDYKNPPFEKTNQSHSPLKWRLEQVYEQLIREAALDSQVNIIISSYLAQKQELQNRLRKLEIEAADDDEIDFDGMKQMLEELDSLISKKIMELLGKI